MCINDTNSETICKPEEDIYELIQAFIITQYYLRETIDLSDI